MSLMIKCRRERIQVREKNIFYLINTYLPIHLEFAAH